MAEQLVATQRTPMTPVQVYAAFKASWAGLLGTEPTRAALLVLLAHWGLETGNGAAANNWNLAGIKHTAGDGHDFATYLTREVVNGESVELERSFRAYASLDEAAIDYLRTLRRDFGFAWPAVEAGDVADFAHRLKIRAYYTAPESEYLAGIKARFAQMSALIPDTAVAYAGDVASLHPLFVPPEPGPPDVPPGEDA